MRLIVALLLAGCAQEPVDIGFKRAAAVDLGHTLAVGESCEQSDCGAGDACTTVARGVEYCIQACFSDADCTQPTIAGGMAPFCLPAAGYCTLSCNPAGAADGTQGCPSGTACTF